MSTWWEQLSFRERVIIFVAAIVGFIIAVDSLVLEQYRLRTIATDESLIQAREDLKWMEQAVLRLPSNTTNQKAVNSGRVVTFVDQKISQLKLKTQMQQMTPIGDHSVRLRLGDVEFSRLLQLFDVIDASLITEEVRISPSETTGFVNVTLVLSNGKKGS